jgi:hypothetical protein
MAVFLVFGESLGKANTLPNRYSYCINNPLIYTDPSGYNWLGDLWSSFWNWCFHSSFNAGAQAEESERKLEEAKQKQKSEIWAGFGKDQYDDLDSLKWNKMFNYFKDNTKLPENPSFEEFKKALKDYEVAILHTHGGEGYLLFSDGKHRLSELNPSDISAKIVGIASCDPASVKDEWDTLNISEDKTRYIDFSVLDNPQKPLDSNYLKSSFIIRDFVDKYLNR